MPSPPSDRGRCISCGFLSKRVEPDRVGRRANADFFRVDPDERVDPGKAVWFTPDSLKGSTAAEFACFKDVADLADEIKKIPGYLAVNAGHCAQQVLGKDRHCAQWCAFEPGRSPSQHLEKADRINWQAMERRAQRRTVMIAVVLALAQIVSGLIVAVLTATSGSRMYELYDWWVRPPARPPKAPTDARTQ